MSKLLSFYWTWSLLFLLQLCSWGYGVKTGPLIRDLLKSELPGRKQGIFLTDYAPEYSVILNLHKDPDGDLHKKEVEEGDFFVRAPNKYGLIAVVQYLSLRTEIRGHSREKIYEICRDYVELSDTRGAKSSQICGFLYLRDLEQKPSKLLGPRVFYSANGEIDVKVFIDKSSEEEFASKLYNTLQISFTAVIECGEGNSAIDNRSVRPCYANKTINTYAPAVDCIHTGLFCDKVYQCGFDEMPVGTDEAGCMKVSNPLSGPLPPPEGGVSGVMIFFIILGVILILVFIGAYVTAELNISLTTCPPSMGMRHGSSSTRIGKETDQVSSTATTPSNYSNFSIEEGRGQTSPS